MHREALGRFADAVAARLRALRSGRMSDYAVWLTTGVPAYACTPAVGAKVRHPVGRSLGERVQ